MEMLFMLIAALGGGFFGAAIGANFAFVMVGFCLLAAVGAAAGGDPEMSNVLFNYVAFGPFVGPHVAFAGGVAASAYATKRGYTDNGKDIVQPLAQLGKVDVLLVGAIFGALGYLIQRGVVLIPWFGSHTDSVAFTVIVSAFLARLIFGDGSLLNPEKFHPTSGNRLAPHEDSYWIRYQETPGQITALGAFAGIFAAGVTLMLATHFPALDALSSPYTLVFGISAITICLLNMGYKVPVTHHITISAGLAAFVFYPKIVGVLTVTEAGWLPGPAIGALLIGAAFGIVAAFLGELFARLFVARGTTHIDPPAFAIWVTNTLIVVIAALV